MQPVGPPPSNGPRNAAVVLIKVSCWFAGAGDDVYVDHIGNELVISHLEYGEEETQPPPATVRTKHTLQAGAKVVRAGARVAVPNPAPNSCNGVLASECDCPGGGKGTATCSNGVWSPCDCQPPTNPGRLLGKHPCSFTDGQGTYNRWCTVTQQQDGALSITAGGTQLNPGTRLTATATAGPSRFDISGSLAWFKCHTDGTTMETTPFRSTLVDQTNQYVTPQAETQKTRAARPDWLCTPSRRRNDCWRSGCGIRSPGKGIGEARRWRGASSSSSG